MSSNSKGLQRSRWAFYAPIKFWYWFKWTPRIGFHLSLTYFSLSLLFISVGIAYEPVCQSLREEIGRMVRNWKEPPKKEARKCKGGSP